MIKRIRRTLPGKLAALELTALALAAGLVAVGLWMTGGPPVGSRPRAPGLVADPPSVEFVADAEAETNAGAGVGREKETTVVLRNDSAATVQILSATASCGCTMIGDINPSVLGPGARTRMTIRGSIPGRGEKVSHIDLKTDDLRNPWLRIPVTLRGAPLRVPFIAHRPLSAQLSGKASGATTPQVVEFSTVEAEGSPRWVRALVARSGRVRVTQEGYAEAAGPEAGTVARTYRFKLALAETLPAGPGDLAGAVDELSLDLTTPSALSVDPLAVTITRVPRLKVVPDTVFIPKSEAVPAERTLLVLVDEDMTPGRVKVDTGPHLWLKADVAEAPPEPSHAGAARRPLKVHSVRVRVTGVPGDVNRETGFAKADLTIRVGDAPPSVLTVPVVVAGQRGGTPGPSQ